MKRTKLLFLSLVLSIASLTVTASEVEATKSTDPSERIQQIQNRVQEIWKLDFSEMGKAEKTEIKEELKTLKKEIKRTDGLDSKVSISVGAIIIILLLIIIIS